MKPITRTEEYLDAINGAYGGESVGTVPEKPITRKEIYLDGIYRKVSGEEPGEMPLQALTREEMYLEGIYENAGSGGGETIPTADGEVF